MQISLQNRLVPISFTDLSDCPNEPHHAIGSPHFKPDGSPKYRDPAIVAVRADIADKELPPATLMVVSSTTYPIFSYGPLFERVKAQANFLKLETLHRELEKKRKLGELFTLPPVELSQQVDEIITAVIAEYGEISTREIVERAIKNLSQYFLSKPHGSTMRLPPIGTGKIIDKKNLLNFKHRELTELILNYFNPEVLLPPKKSNLPPKKILLITPSLQEIKEIANTCIQKALTLTILDLLGIELSDHRFAFGLAYGEYTENQFFSLENWEESISNLDRAIILLTEGKTELSIKTAARAVTKDPFWSEAFKFIESIASREDGLSSLLLENIKILIKKGKIKQAEKLAELYSHKFQRKNSPDLYSQIKSISILYTWKELNLTLKNLDFLKSKEKFNQIEREIQTIPAPDSHTKIEIDSKSPEKQNPPPLEHLNKKKELQKFKSQRDKIIFIKTLSLAIQQIFSPYRDDNALKVLFHQLHTWIKNRWIKLSRDEILFYKKISENILRANPENFWNNLQKIFPHQGGETGDNSPPQKPPIPSAPALPPKLQDYLEIITVLAKFEQTKLTLRELNFQHLNRRKIASLSKQLAEIYTKYNTLQLDFFISCDELLTLFLLLVLLVGPESYRKISEFLIQWKEVLDKKLGDCQKFLYISPKKKEEKIEITIDKDEFPYLSNHISELKQWREFVRNFEHLLSNLLSGGDAKSLSFVYDRAIDTLKKLDKHYLIQLYKKFLGHKWLLLVAAKKEPGIKLEIPGVGEFSLDLLLLVFRKLKIWWKFRGKNSKEAMALLDDFITDKLITSHAKKIKV